MNDEQLEDLKQFIKATVSQSEDQIRSDMTTKHDLGEGLIKIKDKLRDEIKAGFLGVGDSLEEIGKLIDENYAKVNNRLNDSESQLQYLKQNIA